MYEMKLIHGAEREEWGGEGPNATNAKSSTHAQPAMNLHEKKERALASDKIISDDCPT
jgi:hypothetical protein